MTIDLPTAFAKRIRGRTSVTYRDWDHAAKCRGERIDAERLREVLKTEFGTLLNGREMRWRVRRCSVCSGWYVSREWRRRYARAA